MTADHAPENDPAALDRVSDSAHETPGQTGRVNRKSTQSRPARGYSWPPFTDGNEAATTHGAHSERRWRPLADELISELRHDAPWTARPAFRWTVEAWAAAQSKAALVDAWLDEVGLLTDKGTPRPANWLSDKLHARADTLRRELGISPAAFARLLSNFGTVPGNEDALEQLQAEDRRIIEAREAAAAELPEVIGGTPGDGDLATPRCLRLTSENFGGSADE